jgi:cytochrome P450 family 6
MNLESKMVRLSYKTRRSHQLYTIISGLEKSLDTEEIAAQAFLFYIAGSDTSSSLVAYTLYELTLNPELMERVKTEISEVLAGNNNEITYDCLQEMKFLDLCIQETLRKYPGLPILNRICTKDYVIPGSSYTIKEGTSVIISLLGQHRDPAYFPDPESYIPDRFSKEHPNYVADAYIPFGDGPRNCIGLYY